ncbi:non-ribosomal peptide synthetase [Enterobacter quasiroggenkampii]|uniref:non-ribosomal peptide synthetase n=1 Tax=Enterobacter quasiroggenkampii TaxID=2497436 RepID=UPI0021D0A93D|nr:non-ribosomal peptide synthetase [Enterobacter quasiroggenkampii]MCU6346862.1 non-ribosomal peptide synthetase [Enterobacter quasiroggenkampii]
MISYNINNIFTKYADEILFDSEEIKMTYREAHCKVKKISNSLHKYGVGQGGLVCCNINKDVNAILIMLGIMNLGAIYFPVNELETISLDPELNQKLSLVIIKEDDETKRNNNDLNLSSLVIPINILLAESEMLDSCKSNEIDNELLYFIRSSGTTGNPKIIEFKTSAMMNLIEWSLKTYTSIYKPAAKHIISTPLYFDVSIQEILCAFFSGGQFLIPKNHRNDFSNFFKEIIESEGEIIYLTPSILNAFSCFYETQSNYNIVKLSTIITAGEELILNDAILSFIQNNRINIINQYGPSETHVVSSFLLEGSHRVKNVKIPIGTPISNCYFVLLNRDDDTIIDTRHAIGRLVIGGVGLFKGYLNNNALTTSKIKNIIIDGEEKVYYESGDLCYFDNDGKFFFCGRYDEQIKLNGNLINLGYIEANLQKKISDIISNIILIKVSIDYVDKLFAFCIVRKKIFKHELIKLINTIIDHDVIVSDIFYINNIPVTGTGKVDKKKLKKIAQSYVQNNFTAKEDLELLFGESYIIGCWEYVLKSKNIEREITFTDYGGTSLSFVNLFNLLRKRFPLLEIAKLYMFQTLGKQVEYILRKDLEGWINESTTSDIAIQNLSADRRKKLFSRRYK